MRRQDYNKDTEDEDNEELDIPCIKRENLNDDDEEVATPRRASATAT